MDTDHLSKYTFLSNFVKKNIGKIYHSDNKRNFVFDLEYLPKMQNPQMKLNTEGNGSMQSLTINFV